MTYIMSIETHEGKTPSRFQLGPDLALAKSLVEHTYHARVEYRLPVVTIGLLLGDKLMDCYMGDRWYSEAKAEIELEHWLASLAKAIAGAGEEWHYLREVYHFEADFRDGLTPSEALRACLEAIKDKPADDMTMESRT